ncbi:ADP-ribosyltransferase-containing protein [Ursidibacter arcticus]
MTQSNQFDPQAWVFGNQPSTSQTQSNSEQPAFDPQAWVFQNNADKDVTGFGEKQAQNFSEQLAKFPNGTPVQQYQAFEKYGNQFKEHLSTQGYTEEQINKAFSEFSAKADPRNQTSDFEYYLGDRGNNVMVGTGNLASSTLAAAPESIPVIGQWADDAEKYTRDVTKAWEKDISAKAQINEYLGNRAEQEALKNGASEFEALLANLKENPMQIVKLLTEQAPQLVLGAAGKVALGVTNVLGGAGRVRNDIEEAYETTAKENPAQLLQLPEIQTRLAQGMSFEEAVNDAKTDITDNWKSILAGAAIGGSEAFTPAGKVFQGLNRGVMGTFAKEVGQEAFQEGAEQLNSNLAVGQIDGKTEVFDNVVRNATLGAIAGAGMGVPTAIDAYFNKDKSNDDENILREVENSATAGVEATRKAQEANQDQATNLVDGVNQKALEAVLSSVQDEQERNDYHDELKKDIKDGLLEQRIAEGGTYGKLAQAYLDATNPVNETNEQAVTSSENIATQEVEQETPTDNTLNSNVKQSTPYQSNISAEDYPRFQAYLSDMQTIISLSGEEQAQKSREVQQKYGKDIELFNQEIANQFIANNPALAQELVGRVVDSETQAEQELYSRSPMKSVETNIKRGRESMNTAIAERRTVHRAMFNHDLDGWVDFEWGDIGIVKDNGKTKGAMGIAHILEARMRKDGMSYAQATKMLTDNIVETIAKGKIVDQFERNNVQNIKMDYNGYRAALRKAKGSNSWIVTAFELFEDGNSQGDGKTIPTEQQSYTARTVAGASNFVPTGEQVGSNTPNLPTQSLPTLQLQGMGAVGANNVQQSNQQRNNQIHQDQQTLSRILGEETASHIQVVDSNTQIPSGQDVKKLVANGVEGWFEPSTQKLYIISENIIGNDVLSRDERLAWVAWHELAHAGVRIKYGAMLKNLLESAAEHPVVNVITRRIQAEYAKDGIKISKEAAIEEAIVELYSAYQTGNWSELESRYQAKIHKSWKDGKDNVGDFLARIGNLIRRLMGVVIGRDVTQTMTTSQLFDTLRGIEQGINNIAKNSQNPTANTSTNEEARYSFAGQNARNADIQQMGKARAMLSDGVDPEIVRQQTGWFKGADGKWRFELNEDPELIMPYQVYDDFRFDTEYTEDVLETTLSEVWKDSNLFEAYPHLAQRKVTIKPLNGKDGYFEPSTGEIVLSSSLSEYQMRSVLVHEVQHAIQAMEGFLNGNSPTAEIGNFTDKTFTGNSSVDTKINALQEALFQTQDPEKKANLQGQIQAYREMVAENNYFRSAGEVEARNAQTRLTMSQEERRNRSPESTEDVPRQSQILRGYRNTKVYSLNENADSDFAKAVDAVANGERTATTEIVLGTTPDVLKMLGVDEANVIMHARTLQKDMIGKHSVSAEAMKQLPKQMNDPVAVMRSRGSSTNPDAYLVLTELKEVENGKELPIIAALSFEKNANGDLELINVASAYGRKNVKVAKDLEAGTLYWHKEKGNQFLDNFSLSAESDFNLPALRSSLSDNDYLSENNIKTETDLSQYQDESSDNSTRYSKTDRSTYEQAKANGETELTFEQYQQVRTSEFKAWFGDWENDPENASKVINPKTGEPLVVYHGSNADFSVFEKTQETDYGWYGEGYYFTQDRDIADSYADMAVLERGGNQTNYGVYLNLRNPNYVNLSNGSLVTNKNSVSAKETTNKLKSQGFDGVVVFENVSGKAQGKTPYNFAEEVVAFDSNQIKSATDNNGAFDPNNNDIRYSRIKPTVLDQIQSGKIHRKEEEETLLDMVKERDFGRFWETLKSKTDRAWADEQRPVIDWLANLEKDGLISHAERVDIVNKMEAAEGVKNAKNAQMMQKYLKPLMQNIAKVAKKHNITTDQAKFWIEHYLSARWAIEKNQQYLDNEFKAMQEAETALLDAQNNGDQKQIDEASRAYRKAERQYRYRKADVESTVYGRDNDGNLLYTPKVGTAGGWSTPHAQAIMKAIEQKGLTVSEIEQAAKPMFEAIQENLLINLAANRITPEQFREFKKTPNYVPLTGDNEIDLDKDNDYIGGAGRRATNVSKDKAAKGRTQSEAEGAFDATWRMLDKTITNAAWQPFKNSIDELYETAKSDAIAQGASDKEATELAEEKTGIKKNVRKGTTSDKDVLVRKFNNVYYEYHLPTSVMAALNGSQTSSPLNDLWGFRHAKTLTGWFARGVTQFKPMFALKNMVRDGWEKSILITTREILDNNGNDLSKKAKNQIGKEMSKLLWGANLGLNGLYKATAKFAKEGGTANLDNRKDAQGNYINKEQGYLKELIDAGGLSTYSTMLARTRKDLDAEFKRTANPKVYDGAMQLVEIWNTTFDTASSLAAYMALRENGISAERAMGVTLGLMNFRKAGAYAKHFKGFFAFMNPAIQGGKNNLQLIRTRRGQAYLVSRVAMGMLVYQLLSLMAGDDDEAGKRMDSKGDITREIIIPTPAGDIRIPVGYGAPQMAWNLSVNAMRWFNGQIPLSDAIANVVSHNVKSVVPVSPNETSAAKDPFAKVINTLAPTILKPFVELATDRNAFGNKITPSYVNEKELHATQSKSNTAQFWEDVATTMYDTFGMDAHPESYQHLFNAYRGFAGSVGDFISATIENPNRLKQGKELSIPVINDFFTIGGKGENRISILYYEGKGEMEALKKAYDYQKEHHPKTLSEWLKEGNRQQLLELNELANKRMGIIRKIKANATKDLNAKKISQEVYDKRITFYNKRVDEEQRRILYKYRTLEGLNTTKTH